MTTSKLYLTVAFAHWCMAAPGVISTLSAPPCATESLWLSNSFGLAYNWNHKFDPSVARTEGSHYYASITVGEAEPEVFQVLIDTGSADFWLPTSAFAKQFNYSETIASPEDGNYKKFGNGSVKCADSYGTGKVDKGILFNTSFNVAGNSAEGPVCLEVKGQSSDVNTPSSQSALSQF